MKLLIFILASCSILLILLSPVLASGGAVDLTIEGDVLSANLKGTPLKDILEKLEKEKGIWWKGSEGILGQEVTIEFRDLPIEEGVKRILSSMSYSLIFHANGRLAGVFIIGKKGSAQGTSRDRAFAAKTSTPSVGKEGHGTQADERFKVVKNLPPPGGPVTPSAEMLKSFKVIRDLPPPGGPVNPTAEELEKFKVIKNLPPPGGTVEVSEEVLESFKVRKNLPAPGS